MSLLMCMLCLFVEETVCSSAVMDFEFVLGVHGMILFFCFFCDGSVPLLMEMKAW